MPVQALSERARAEAVPTGPAPARDARGPAPAHPAVEAPGPGVLPPDEVTPDHVVGSHGNAAARELLGRGAVADQVPSPLALAGLGASFSLPADKPLTGGWNPVTTGEGANVWLELSSQRMRVSVWPPLVVDAQWPMSNVEISGVEVDFATGEVVKVETRNTQTPFAFGARTFVDGAVREFVDGLRAGTPLAKPGYDPLHDPDPAGTLRRIYANVGGGKGEGAGEDGVKPQDVTRITPSATFATTDEVVAGAGGGQVTVPKGTTVRAAAQLQGNAADLLAGKLPGLDSVAIDSDGLVVSRDGKPVAKLTRVTLHRGGAVTVDRFEPLGDVAGYADTERGLKGLFTLFQLAALRSGVNPGPISTRTDADVVEGVARAELEKALTEAARTLVAQHAGAVPGADLRALLGVPPESAAAPAPEQAPAAAPPRPAGA